jgi:site-specific DNA recombinase
MTKTKEIGTMKESKRAALYARVSGDDRGKEGRNLAGQLEMGREYAQEHGYTVAAELSEDDRGASGAEIDLPELNRIREMAVAGEFDVLVVREIDRLSRNLAKQLIVEQELERAGVSIEYVLGEYPDTPEGNLQKHVKAAVAEYEREQITQRMIRGRYNKVKAGKVHLHGNRPPYGYRASEDGDNLVPYEPEARIIRLIFQWYTEGDETSTRLSMMGIAKRLTEMKVPTWSDIHGATRAKTVGVGVWRSTTVRDVLRSKTYMGRWGYGMHNGRRPPSPHAIEVEVPPLVSVETWQAAQVQRKINTVEAKRNTRNEYLMRRRVACTCGYSMGCLGTSTKRKRIYLYYRCNRGSTLPGGGCGAPSFRADYVDAMVWNWLKDWLRDPKELAEKLEVYRAEREKANIPILAQIEAIDDLLREHRTQLERLIDLYLSGAFDKDMLVDRKKRLEDTIAKLEVERGNMETCLQDTLPDDQICEVATFGERLSAGLETADKDFAERRRIIELLDARAILAVEDGEKVVRPTFILSKEPGSTRLSLAGCAGPHR